MKKNKILEITNSLRFHWYHDISSDTTTQWLVGPTHFVGDDTWRGNLVIPKAITDPPSPPRMMRDGLFPSIFSVESSPKTFWDTNNSFWASEPLHLSFMVKMVCNHLGYLVRKPLGARNLSFTGHRSTGCIGIRLQTSSGWPSCWSKRLKNQRLGHCVVM